MKMFTSGSFFYFHPGTWLAASWMGFRIPNPHVLPLPVQHLVQLLLAAAWINCRTVRRGSSSHPKYRLKRLEWTSVQATVGRVTWDEIWTDMRPASDMIWVFPKIGGKPQNGWFVLETPIKMNDLGGKPTSLGNTHMVWCDMTFKSGWNSRNPMAPGILSPFWEIAPAGFWPWKLWSYGVAIATTVDLWRYETSSSIQRYTNSLKLTYPYIYISLENCWLGLMMFMCFF